MVHTGLVLQAGKLQAGVTREAVSQACAPSVQRRKSGTVRDSLLHTVTQQMHQGMIGGSQVRATLTPDKESEKPQPPAPVGRS